MPWATYTDPEVAHVGLSASEVAARGLATFRYDFADIDRAKLDGQTRGFVKIALDGRRIVSATVVGEHAGELLGAFNLAVTQRMSVQQLVDTVQPYPTRADAIRRVGMEWAQGRLTPTIRGWLARFLAWRR